LKRFVAILFTLFYIIPAIGVSLDIHKCGKKIKVISVNAAHENKCPCGTDMPFDCCKDFHVKVKIQDSQKVSKSSLDFRLSEIKQFAFASDLKIAEPSSQVQVFDFSSYHAPPFKSKRPVYLTNSIFLI
jgi:hypothetical protein